MPGLIPFLLDRLSEGRSHRDEEEQVRRLLEQQAQIAESLRASGTVPSTFGSLLQSFQPPPPAPPPAQGIMGTLGQTFGDLMTGGRHRPPAGLLQEESQQQTLNELFKQQAEQQKETAREKQQTARETAMESRRAATQSSIETRQQAGFTEAEARRAASSAEAERRQQASFTEAEARRAATAADAEKRQTERGVTRAAEQKTAAETRAAERANKTIDRLIIDGTNSKAEVDLWNDLLTRYPRPGFSQRQWQPGTWTGMLPFTAGSAKSKAVDVNAGTLEGGAAATAAKAAATPSTLSDAELRKRLGL